MASNQTVTGEENVFRVVPKSDYLTGQRVYSVQEYTGNQFCGHWCEIDWALDLGAANKRLRTVRS